MEEQAWHCELAHCLNERLADANSLAAEERTEAERVSGRASWSQEVRAGRVEALGDEPLGLKPLIGVVAKSEHVNSEKRVSSQSQLVILTLLQDSVRGRKVYWWLHAQ